MPLQGDATVDARLCYQVSFTRKGKRSTMFAKAKHRTAVRKQLENNERTKPLMNNRVELATELSTQRLNKDAG